MRHSSRRRMHLKLSGATSVAVVNFLRDKTGYLVWSGSAAGEWPRWGAVCRQVTCRALHRGPPKPPTDGTLIECRTLRCVCAFKGWSRLLPSPSRRCGSFSPPSFYKMGINKILVEGVSLAIFYDELHHYYIQYGWFWMESVDLQRTIILFMSPRIGMKLWKNDFQIRYHKYDRWNAVIFSFLFKDWKETVFQKSEGSFAQYHSIGKMQITFSRKLMI